MNHSIASQMISLDNFRQRSDAEPAVQGIKAVHALTCRELERVELAMQSLRRPASVAPASDDELLDAYLHVYTNLISAIANVEEALQWMQKTRPCS